MTDFTKPWMVGECPECGAKDGEPCVDTSSMDYYTRTGTEWFHTRRLEAKLASLEKSEKTLKDCLEEFSEYDCVYGDNCPTFGSRHGQCIGCKAREALKDAVEPQVKKSKYEYTRRPEPHEHFTGEWDARWEITQRNPEEGET